MAKKELNEKELEYLSSLSAAVLHKAPKRSKVVIYFWILVVIVIIVWASITKVDEIVRASGKIIPFGENKVLQNLEGGIVEDILAKEGDKVKKNQVLLKIKNIKSKADLAGYISKYKELYAKSKRLKAQASLSTLAFRKDFFANNKELCAREKDLYDTNIKELRSKIDTFKKQIAQKDDQLVQAKTKIKNLQKSYNLISEEVKISKPMVEEGVKSKIDFLKLQREANNIKTEIDSTKKSIPQIYSSIKEIKSKIKEVNLSFKSQSQKELNSIIGEMDRVSEKIKAFKDSVRRTLVRSPVDGIIKKLFVNTIGGVVKPGMDLAEIVPDNKSLIAEVKVKPKDIAFIYPSQKALIKFSAYNYSIYGGLKGEVISISPDTMTDKRGKTFYIVRIKTDKNALFYGGKKLKIIPGMTVNVDIITGKRTILEYIVKPILNSKDYIFADR